MNRIIECYYDDDNYDLVATFETGIKIVYSCSEIEDSLNLNTCKRSKLDWLSEHCPEECLQLYLDNKLQLFLDNYEKQVNYQENVIRKQLESVYDKSTADLIAHEMIVYGDTY